MFKRYQEQLDFIKPIQDVVKVEKISESAFYIKYSIFGNTYKLEVGCLDNPDVLCNTTFSKLKVVLCCFFLSWNRY